MAKQKPINLVVAGVDRVTDPIRKINQRIESMQRPVRRVARSFRALAREARLDRLGRAVRGVGRELGALARRGALFATALGTGAAVALKRFIDTGDAIGKTADSIGIGVETLQEYRFAADRSGVAQDKLDRSFQRFARTLGETKAGTGALKTLLDKLSPSLLQQLRAVGSTDEGLQVLFGALEKIEDQSLRAAIANAAFGRSGIELTNMLKGGVGGLQAMIAEVREYGGVMSEQAVRASEEAQDNLTNLMTIVRGLGFALGSELLPEVNQLIVELTGWLKQNRELVKTELVRFARDLARNVRELVGFLKVAVPATAAFVASIGGLKTVLLVTAGIIGAQLIVSLVQLGSAIVSVAARLPALITAVKALNLAFLTNPIFLTIAAIGALIAIGVLLVKHWDKVKAFFVSMWKTIAESPLRFFIPGLGPIFAAVALIEKAWEPLKAFFSDLWERVSAIKSATGRFLGLGGGDEDTPARAPQLPARGPGFRLPELAPARSEVSGQIGMRVSLAPGLTGSIDRMSASGGIGLLADVGPIMAQ